MSTVKLFSVSNMVLNYLSVAFVTTKVLKLSRKGTPLEKVEYRSYTNKKLCIMSCLREHLARRDKHVGLNTDQLIILLKKPFKGTSIDAMRSWFKDISTLNNIDFSPHSCRTSSTSKAKNMEVNIGDTLKRGFGKIKNTFSYFMIKS